MRGSFTYPQGSGRQVQLHSLESWFCWILGMTLHSSLWRRLLFPGLSQAQILRIGCRGKPGQWSGKAQTLCADPAELCSLHLCAGSRSPRLQQETPAEQRQPKVVCLTLCDILMTMLQSKDCTLLSLGDFYRYLAVTEFWPTDGLNSSVHMSVRGLELSLVNAPGHLAMNSQILSTHCNFEKPEISQYDKKGQRFLIGSSL